MAKIKEQNIVITLSALVKNQDKADSSTLVSDDILANLEAIVQELVGDSIVVEVSSGE
jgi:hypothetical protein